MELIYSKVEPDKLLHIINRFAEIDGRLDIIPPDNFIQCATLRMSKGTTFRPHKHLEAPCSYDDKIAQESWVVLRGRVRCIFYDLDDTVIATPVLGPGDASFTLRGGHNYEILEEDSVVYEFKTGPYLGQQLDKTFLNETNK